MNFKKKAIEPIVATILLVVVAVILVTIVLAWGKNFTTGGLNEAGAITNDACKGATLSLESCDWNSDTNKVVFTLKNTSDTYTFAANDFYINVTDSSTVTESDLDNVSSTSALGPGASLVEDITVSGIVATKVKLNVRSIACPTVAVNEIECS